MSFKKFNEIYIEFYLQYWILFWHSDPPWYPRRFDVTPAIASLPTLVLTVFKELLYSRYPYINEGK